jgi:hypothetical protein
MQTATQCMQPGTRILCTLTPWESKVKYKVHMTIRGDQQVEGKSIDPSDLYAPVLKAHEALLLVAITAADSDGCPAWKTDQSQAFLTCPDWWPEPGPEGHCLQLLKSI